MGIRRLWPLFLTVGLERSNLGAVRVTPVLYKQTIDGYTEARRLRFDPAPADYKPLARRESAMRAPACA
ncbi:hypothetical protein SBA6_690028 [Candidatus Sulfopaludibacter sp. SbA6]|nr:hypothetical protein SBA6_690028 [Candidatus Sulfopaludibacter sp. SbA6]